MSKSIRSVWFSERFGKAWTSLIKRYQTMILISYCVAIVLSFFAYSTNARVGQWISTSAALVGLWGSFSSILLLRADIVNLLLGTYEIWFFSIVNTASLVLLGIYFSDLRVLFIPVFYLSIQSSIFVDANITRSRHFVFTSLPAASFITMLLVLIGFGILDDTHSFVLFPSHTRAMAAETALTNGWSTIALIMYRNMYRQREAIKKLDFESKLVQCVSHRAKVKLVRVQNPSTASSPGLVRAKSTMNTTLILPVSMKLVTTGKFFDATSTVFPINRTVPIGVRLPLSIRVVLLVVALTGLCLTCCVFLQSQGGSTLYVMGVGSLVATGVFSGISLAICQRQLLRHILLSFDFVFLSLQITFAHLSLCDLLYWDHRCWGVGASLLWMHWVLTIDAVTSVMKRQWGIHMWLAAVVVVLFIMTQIIVVACLVFDAGVDLQDRSVYDVKLWDTRSNSACQPTPDDTNETDVGKSKDAPFASPVVLVFILAQLAMMFVLTFGVEYDVRDRVMYRAVVRRRRIAVKIAPFLLSRIFTLLGWSCRILWRIWTQQGDELILFHGSVFYDSKLSQVHLRKVANRKRSAVLPMLRTLLAGGPPDLTK